MKKVLAISGSIRKNSSSTQLIDLFSQLSKPDLSIELFEGLAALPYFNSDLTENPPDLVKVFCQKIKEAQGVLICTPEYVFSLPGVLKNALEWTVASSDFVDKPAALILASTSGEKAYESLCLIMKTLMADFKNTSLLIKGARAKLTKEGKLKDQ